MEKIVLYFFRVKNKRETERSDKMKKSIFVVLSLAGLLFVYVSSAQAQASIDVSLTLPQGTVGYKMSKVIANPPFDGTTDVFGPATETSVNFGTLAEVISDGSGGIPAGTALGIFAPADHSYFAIDIAPQGGTFPVSVTQVSVSYTSNSGGVEAGKISATSKQMTFLGFGINPQEDLIAKELLNTLPRIFLKDPYFTGHWVRVYVGVVTNPTADGFPATAVFTAGDYSGLYSGTFGITVF